MPISFKSLIAAAAYHDHVDPVQPLRVLIVEDTLERQKVLTTLYRRHAWVLVHTARRAITMLDAFDFDIVSLDYNLPGEATGEQVAQAVARSRNHDSRVVIHSLNPRGAARMAAVLPHAIVYPVSRIARSNQHFKRLQAGIDRHGARFDWWVSTVPRALSDQVRQMPQLTTRPKRDRPPCR